MIHELNVDKNNIDKDVASDMQDRDKVANGGNSDEKGEVEESLNVIDEGGNLNVSSKGDQISHESQQSVPVNACGQTCPVSQHSDSSNTINDTVIVDVIEDIGGTSNKETSNSYAQVVDMVDNVNKLFVVPTGVNDKGEEVLVFYEDLVKEGSEKWKNTVQKWDPEVIFRLGKPIMMDQMNADMRNKGIGWLGYARVLVEIDAAKAFLNSIEINYVDNQCKNKRTKWVKVEYIWKPIVCSHCKVFGHNLFKCDKKPNTVVENEKAKNTQNKDMGRDVKVPIHTSICEEVVNHNEEVVNHSKEVVNRMEEVVK
ncbi:hypothetical protein Tco_0567056 [Tanacetum coccineum]